MSLSSSVCGGDHHHHHRSRIAHVRSEIENLQLRPSLTHDLRTRRAFPPGHNYSHNLWLDVSHVRPSYRPSPVVAQDGCTYQFLSLIRVRPSFSWISCGFMAVKALWIRTNRLREQIFGQRLRLPSGRSCLLAKIRIMASRISLSLIILCSSVRASSIRSRSAQSTTNIRP